MSLPEPEFITRDAEDITLEMLDAYEQSAGKRLYPAQMERLIIDMIAYREMLVRIAIQDTAKQCLVEYAHYPALDLLGELVGVSRLNAQPAKTTLRFTLSAALDFGVAVPEGTEVQSGDGQTRFRSDEAATIPAGSLYVDAAATAAEAGDAGNGYLAGEINLMTVPIPYVSGAQNTTATSGGSDEEADERLRERIKEAPERFSNAGSRGAYHYWAMTAHPDIIDAAVMSPEPGVVNVYPLTKDGSPTAEIIGLVEAILNDEKVRPLTDQVFVPAPASIAFQISADVVLFKNADTDSVQAEVAKRLEAYRAGLRARLGRDIVRSQIAGLIITVPGAYSTVINSPAYDMVLAVNEWADCTGMTVNYAGYVDG